MLKTYQPYPVPSTKTPLEETFEGSSFLELADIVKAGAPYTALIRGAKMLNLSENRFADIVGIPSSTLARRRKEKRLSVEESERLYRFIQLLERAIDVLEDADYARVWLGSPNEAFGAKTPLDIAKTEPGAQAVHNLLTRVEYGVFS